VSSFVITPDVWETSIRVKHRRRLRPGAPKLISAQREKLARLYRTWDTEDSSIPASIDERGDTTSVGYWITIGDRAHRSTTDEVTDDLTDILNRSLEQKTIRIVMFSHHPYGATADAWASPSEPSSYAWIDHVRPIRSLGTKSSPILLLSAYSSSEGDAVRWSEVFERTLQIPNFPSGPHHVPGCLIASPKSPAQASTLSNPVDAATAEPGFTFVGHTAMRVGGSIGFGLVFLSIPLLLLSTGIGLAGMFLGAAIFCLANYIAYRFGEDSWIIEPGIAARGVVGALFLALVAVVATATNAA
jgi:hypothetical protein